MSEKSEDRMMHLFFVAVCFVPLFLAIWGTVRLVRAVEREQTPRCECTTLKSDEIFIKNMKYIRELKENGGPI